MVNKRALDWWNNLPVQNLQNMNESWVGYLWKYYPNENSPYGLTDKQIYNIWLNETLIELRKLKIEKLKNR